ncbi:hypothetical protein AX16_000375 [Volvariella volvacea WC 439]|nr:hypothetical protein AX16_000375 [Volvariella volvacea WC 439]
MADRDPFLKYSESTQRPHAYSSLDARPDPDKVLRSLPRQMPPVNHVRQRHRSEALHSNSSSDPSRPRRTAASSMLVPSDGALRHNEVDGAGPLSLDDEYDLSREDPKIMQDVERAVFLKRQREARLRAQQDSIPTWHREHRRASSSTATSSPSPQPLPKRRFDERNRPTTPSSAKSMEMGSFSSMADLNTHPLPCSVDDGRTLDWSSAATEIRSDKRWSLSLSKRRNTPSLASTADQIHKLEKLYTEHINNIKRKCSFQTISKANVVKNQLERRYHLMTPSPKYPTLNILDVYRWYREQSPNARVSLESLEPFSWLKEDEASRTLVPRSPRYLSAAVVERCIHSQDQPKDYLYHQESQSLSYPVDSAMSSRSTKSRASETRLPPVYEDGIDSPSRGSLPIQSETSSRNEVIDESPLDSDVGPQSNVPSDLGSELRIVIDHGSPSSGLISPPEFRNNSSTSASNLDVSRHSRSRPSLGGRELNEISGTARSTRVSLPSMLATSKPANSPRKVEIDEKRLAIGYMHKTRVLADITAQNARSRQLLHRISALVREHEVLQSNTLRPLGIRDIPHIKELSESLNHDPAAVTGNTRKLKGWKAVEDIHCRLVRQRALFRQFLEANHAPECKWSLDQSINSLRESLDKLQENQRVMTEEGHRVASLLNRVRDTHVNVKETYKRVLAETSTPYVELSDIVVLEENYRDKYQQVWEWCMNVLTFLFDTITPFWRTYGKTIGEDIRDFLIIPLYRNEFTGEPKRYSIKSLPRRTFCHWVVLSLICATSWIITSSATYLACSLMSYYRLQWIPYESFRWVILPMFWASIAFFWTICILGAAFSVLQLGTLVWWLGWSLRVLS